MVTLTGAQPFRDGRAIDRGVARADHHDVAPDRHAAGVQLALLDVLESVDDQFLAGDSHRLESRQARRPRKTASKRSLQIVER